MNANSLHESPLPVPGRRIDSGAVGKSLLALALGLLLTLLLVGRREVARGAVDGTDPVRRGQYLVTVGGCNDCHTPFKLGPAGAEPDMSRMLSGHPESLQMPAPPGPGRWTLALVGCGDQHRLRRTLGHQLRAEPHPR